MKMIFSRTFEMIYNSENGSIIKINLAIIHDQSNAVEYVVPAGLLYFTI